MACSSKSASATAATTPLLCNNDPMGSTTDGVVDLVVSMTERLSLLQSALRIFGLDRRHKKQSPPATAHTSIRRIRRLQHIMLRGAMYKRSFTVTVPLENATTASRSSKSGSTSSTVVLSGFAYYCSLDSQNTNATPEPSHVSSASASSLDAQCVWLRLFPNKGDFTDDDSARHTGTAASANEGIGGGGAMNLPGVALLSDFGIDLLNAQQILSTAPSSGNTGGNSGSNNSNSSGGSVKILVQTVHPAMARWIGLGQVRQVYLSDIDLDQTLSLSLQNGRDQTPVVVALRVATSSGSGRNGKTQSPFVAVGIVVPLVDAAGNPTSGFSAPCLPSSRSSGHCVQIVQFYDCNSVCRLSGCHDNLLPPVEPAQAVDPPEPFIGDNDMECALDQTNGTLTRAAPAVFSDLDIGGDDHISKATVNIVGSVSETKAPGEPPALSATESPPKNPSQTVNRETNRQSLSEYLMERRRTNWADTPSNTSKTDGTESGLFGGSTQSDSLERRSPNGQLTSPVTSTTLSSTIRESSTVGSRGHDKESPDKALHKAVCRALLLLHQRSGLPTTAANFNANFVRKIAAIDLKKTRYKRFGLYLAEQVKAGLIQTRPAVNNDKHGIIIGFDINHSDLVEIRLSGGLDLSEGTSTAMAESATRFASVAASTAVRTRDCDPRVADSCILAAVAPVAVDPYIEPVSLQYADPDSIVTTMAPKTRIKDEIGGGKDASHERDCGNNTGNASPAGAFILTVENSLDNTNDTLAMATPTELSDLDKGKRDEIPKATVEGDSDECNSAMEPPCVPSCRRGGPLESRVTESAPNSPSLNEEMSHQSLSEYLMERLQANLAVTQSNTSTIDGTESSLSNSAIQLDSPLRRSLHKKHRSRANDTDLANTIGDSPTVGNCCHGSESQDRALHNAVCRALLSLHLTNDLPMTTAKFYAIFVRKIAVVDLEKTRYKRFGVYLAEQVKAGLIQARPSMHNGQIGTIVGFDINHSDLVQHRIFGQLDLSERTSAAVVVGDTSSSKSGANGDESWPTSLDRAACTTDTILLREMMSSKE